METKEKATEVQGTEEQKLTGVENAGNKIALTLTGEPRKQKISGSYTVKAFAENAKKLKELGYIDNTDLNKLKEIHNKALIEYQKTQLGSW